MRDAVAALSTLALIATAVGAPPAAAQGRSSMRKAQEAQAAQIPRCGRKLGTIAIVEPDNQWWREYNLASPEAVLKVLVQQSGCFTIVNRGRSMQSRSMERALADAGELQRGSNVGRGQVRTADYFLEPDIMQQNRNSGGTNVGAVLGAVGGLFGGLGRTVGRAAGGVNVRKGEASVTLSVVNARTTEETAITEGYAQKSNVGFNLGAALSGSSYGGAEMSSYQNSTIGQVIILAYLDAYKKLVTQMGGMPSYPQAPLAEGEPARAQPAFTPSRMATPAATATRGRLGITNAGYTAIKVGMTKAQVAAIIGPGNEHSSTDATESYDYRDGDVGILVVYNRGRVLGKSKVGF